MTEFAKSPKRNDPYKNFKFRVKWEGNYVAGVSSVSALSRSTEVIEHREGGDPNTVHKSPGQTSFEPITLERGVTHDKAFERWANKSFNQGAGLGMEVSLADLRKTIIIELKDVAGQNAIRYYVYRCWVSEYQALPDLDAGDNAVAIQTLTLQHEGFERDYDLSEPEPPQYTKPEA